MMPEKNLSNPRKSLPFRKNCEGYFTDGAGNILAKDTGKGYIEFPGGGINEGETPEASIIRETFEETGAYLEEVKYLGSIKFVWNEAWAKTKKQKARYNHFQGEEMHFFSGKVKELKKTNPHKDIWNGEKLMPIKEAIRLIKKNKPFSKGLKGDLDLNEEVAFADFLFFARENKEYGC